MPYPASGKARIQPGSGKARGVSDPLIPYLGLCLLGHIAGGMSGWAPGGPNSTG